MIKRLLFLLPFTIVASEKCLTLLPQGEIKNIFENDPNLYDQKERIQSGAQAYNQSIYQSKNTFFNKCQKTSSVGWEKEISNPWKLSWAIVFENGRQKINKAYDHCLNQGKEAELEQAIKEVRADLIKHFILIRQCQALSLLSRQSDYDNIDLKKKSSFDNLITCKRSSVLTQDWQGCLKLITTYDAAHVALQAIVATQAIDFKATQGEILKGVNDDSVKGPLKAQIEVLKKQQQYGQQQSLAYGAQATALTVTKTSIITMEKLLESCNNDYAQKTAQEEFVKSMRQLDPSFQLDYKNQLIDVDQPTVCVQTIKAHSNLKLIENDQAISAAKQATIEMGIKAGTQLLISNLIGKNIKKLEAMLNDVKNFDPSDLNYSLEDLIARECQLDPQSENCQVGSQIIQNQSFAGSSFSIASTTRAQSSDIVAADSPHSATTDHSQNDSTQNSFVPIDRGNHNPSGLQQQVNAGSVKSTIKSGSNNSGAISPQAVAAPQGNSTQKSNTHKTSFSSPSYSYKQAKKSTLYRNGGKSNNSRKEPSDNNFAHLFKKKSEVARFEQQKKKEKNSTSLFEVISNRYNLINKSKRLLSP